MKLPEIFNTYKPYIEKEIKTLFCDTAKTELLSNGPSLNEMMEYHMGWVDENGRQTSSGSGKYLRATLTLLSCDSLCDDFKKALPLAAAIELIHNFSLVHDDIQDGDEKRRHRPTVWKIWGKPQAINVGSAMKTIANLSVVNLLKANVEAERLINIFKVLDESCLRMIEGQFLDIDFETRTDITAKDYLKMVERKTAALIECSLQIGALVVISPSEIVPFKKFGKHMGMAFQIRDDILGIWGSDEITGKSNGNDIRKKKKSFPVVFAMSNAGKSAGKELMRIYGKKDISEEDIETILNIFDSLDVKKVSEDKTKEFYSMALDELNNLPVDSGKSAIFEEISSFLINRDF